MSECKFQNGHKTREKLVLTAGLVVKDCPGFIHYHNLALISNAISRRQCFRSSYGQESSLMSRGPRGRRTGKCKWFHVAKGYGFITPDDDQPDVFVHQSVIQMQGFRSLKDGEAVEFEWQESDKGFEATFVCGIGGADCQGSDRRPVSSNRRKRVKCYNCGDYGHIANRCPHGPLPKRCHLCKSEGHLIADCPTKAAEPKT